MATRIKNRRLQLENLEDRRLMAANLTNDGELIVHGTDGNDYLSVMEYGSVVYLYDNGDWRTFGRPNRIVMHGHGGNDTMVNHSQIWSTMWGHDGHDTILGGSAHDLVFGGRGDDTLLGREGVDQLFGGDGADTIFGGNGSDQVFGNGGSDMLFGGDGADYLVGGAGDDTIRGDAGADYMLGDAGNDNLYGGKGVDVLLGGAGNDGLFGGGQADLDYLVGGTGADRFLVNADSDHVIDSTAIDATIEFKNSEASTPSYAGFGEVAFAAGNWTDAEIEKVDVALNNLHHHVGNTKLLKQANGGQVTLFRQGRQITELPGGAQILGGNGGGGTIAFSDLTFSNDLMLWKTIYHEVGHNWDDPAENEFIDDFRQISGWVQSDSNPAYRTVTVHGLPMTVSDGRRFAESNQADDNWWYLETSSFTRADGYSQQNPAEDYATNWETYFAQKYHGTTDGNTVVAAKHANLDRLFASLA